MKFLLRNPIYTVAILSGAPCALIGYLIAHGKLLLPTIIAALVVACIMDLNREWRTAQGVKRIVEVGK